MSSQGTGALRNWSLERKAALGTSVRPGTLSQRSRAMLLLRTSYSCSLLSAAGGMSFSYQYLKAEEPGVESEYRGGVKC